MTSPSVGRPPDPLTFAFAPIHKAALGVATGLVTGLLVFAVTAFHVIVQPVGGPPLELLAQYFHGYTVSWAGALLGFSWGFVTGFVIGFFAAFICNTTVALYVFALKTKAELERTADFLDHI